MNHRFVHTILIITSVLTLLSGNLTAQKLPEPTWRYYRPGNTGIQGDDVTAVWVDANGNPYIAANTGMWGEGGFARFNVAENTWTNFSNVDWPVLGSFDNADVHILDIVEDYEGNLWMGNFPGALKFNPQTGITAAVQYGTSNSPLQGFTYDVDVAPDSSIWFTSGGLVQYIPETDQWNSFPSSNVRIAIQPKPDGSYLVWSADTYYGIVITYNSATGLMTDYTPTTLGELAGLPGKDCVDDAGNLWALRMSVDGNWETIEYQRPDGTWVAPTPPYENASYYIDAFKAYGNEMAVMVLENGETWLFNGTSWQNYGSWMEYANTYSVDIDQQGNVWVCGSGGAAKRDVQTGYWQRYRITNTSQIDYFVGDLTIDAEGSVWFTGNAGSGVGGFQKFDGANWTGFNEYTYGLGYPFPYMSDNTDAIYYRPSTGDIIFNPTFNGIHAWTGSSYFPLEDYLTSSEGFAEDDNGKLWSIGEYYSLRYYNEVLNDWGSIPITGWGLDIIKDPTGQGIWAVTDYEIVRTDGTTTFRRGIEDFPGSSTWFTGFAADADGIVWVGTWAQFTSTGSTLIRLDTQTGLYQTWSYDEGWPFPGEHVRPLTITPDGKLWMQYDSEYPSTEAGILWFDGTNIGLFPSSPGGIPQWGGLPNSSIKDLEVKVIPNGYELWMSCLGRGIAVLSYFTTSVDVPINNIPEPVSAFTISPNPVSEAAKLRFPLENSTFVELDIFDIMGKKVKDLLTTNLQKGPQEVEWNLTDQSGARVAAGIYIARLKKAGSVVSTKVAVQ